MTDKWSDKDKLSFTNVSILKHYGELSDTKVTFLVDSDGIKTVRIEDYCYYTFGTALAKLQSIARTLASPKDGLDRG